LASVASAESEARADYIKMKNERRRLQQIK
jgi:hypothetical protein